MPVAVKDIFDTAGIPTENGSALFRGRVPTTSAAVVTNVERAGAIVIGKTVTAELAFYHPGPTTNPHDPARTPGGSSMGSAAAVAAGVVPAAIGSQTNGSVIRPAAFCGVVGFKPSGGRLPRDGVFEFSRTLDQVGSFATTVRDVALFTAAMAGEPLVRWWEERGDVGPRFAAVRTSEWEHAEPAMRERFQADIDTLALAGGPIEWPRLPKGLDDGPRLVRTIMLFEAARAFGDLVEQRPDAVSAVAREAIAEGARTPAPTYRAALRERDRLRAAFNEWTAPYDAILTPPTTGEAPGLETTGDPRFCSRWTLVGAPAIVIPTGRGPNDLPLGLQLVGGVGDDARLLSAAAWAESLLAAPR